MEQKLILIDPGHGATADSDNFRVSPSGIREENINLKVALKLEELLKAKNFKTTLIRTEDTNVELTDRVKLAKEIKPDLFISIHHNSSDPVDPELNYSCLFCHGDLSINSSSLQLAKKLKEQFEATRKTDCYIFSDQLVFESGFHLTRELKDTCPTVISEYSFFSNPDEDKKFQSEEFYHQQAEAIATAIQNFFNEEKAEEQPKPLDYGNFKSELNQLRDEILNSETTETWKSYYQKGEFKKSLAMLPNSPVCQELLKKILPEGIKASSLVLS